MELKHEFSKGEIIANAVSHGAGTLLAIAMLVLLVVFAATKGNAWHVVSFSIFGGCMVFLYLSSTFNHSIQSGKAWYVFHVLDKSAIFLMIAGTYTPYSLVALHGPGGWVLFGIEWGFAVIGIVLESVFGKKWELPIAVFCVIAYVIMGWAAIVVIKPLLEAITLNGVIFLLSGGACYTFGIIFFLWRNLKYHHLVWHLMVIAGSILHFFSIFFYVLPIEI